ncbi:endoglucanase EG-1 precursor [Podospora australis]|uniref:Glucanase n=1 Tax=Podospora australis TaxID=1536484 RepID=A0AAN6WLS3_9PEZI|nr:endoglucanase EG-1 precursor [Podospora australis]
MTTAQLLAFVAAVATAASQQIGRTLSEVHPLLPSWECTVKGGCIQKNTSVVVDADFRWLQHTVDGSSCKTDMNDGNSLNMTACPDAATCSTNCALQGAHYPDLGISTKGSELTLTFFVNKTSGAVLAAPRVYLLSNEKSYDMFSLLNKEFTVDIDAKDLPCGTNGALFFSEMEANGGRSAVNPGGAQYGTGYCDAQCPKLPFINGEANIDKHGACCAEMDIWEANSRATSFTPHPCNITGLYKCAGELCGTPNRYSSVCDRDGCDFSSYRLGQRSFYSPGPDMAIDTNRKFTIVTQFLTTTGDSTGDLHEIRRLYVQDGKVIQNAQIQVLGIDRGNSLTDNFCAQEKKTFGAVNAFGSQGGLKSMGEALRRGMVLVFCVWNDSNSAMKWLDGTWPVTADPAQDPGTGRGPCKAGEGTGEDIWTNHLYTSVKFSNVKSGEIGSTYPHDTRK